MGWIKDTSVGQRLKFIRVYRGKTQKELGMLLGYPEKQADIRIAQYENNSRTPKADTIVKLAEALNVSPVVFSRTICTSYDDLLQSKFWLSFAKDGKVIHDCETEYAQLHLKAQMGWMSPEEFVEKVFGN